MMFQTVVGRRPRRLILVGVLIAGYLGVWALFGVAVYAGDWFLHQAVDGLPWLRERTWLLSAATLILAGAYQFTPLKYHCLDKCRSPMSFIAERWHGANAAREALALGAHHGLFCVGCCWSLMLLMFAVGAGSLGWMLALGLVMAVEKNMPWGKRISLPLGVILLASGAALLVTGAPVHIH
jgi:predicted metal-binding membrane protein